jgi:hypothetical protein
LLQSSLVDWRIILGAVPWHVFILDYPLVFPIVLPLRF